MASSQSILDDVNLRYRNTFTTAQKLVWMNEEQSELFEILELDSAPVSFPLQRDVRFYPIPVGVDIDRIKTVSIQVNDDLVAPEFQQLPFRENDDNSYTYVADLYYSIVGESFFIPNGTIDDRQIYIYMDKPTTDITTGNIGSEPSVPVRFQELLKLGLLKRIASARKDGINKNNYEADYQEKISNMQEKMALQVPEYHKPIDVMPRSERCRTERYDYRYFNR